VQRAVEPSTAALVRSEWCFSTIEILNRHVEQMVVEGIRKMGTKKKRRNHENRAAKDWGTKPQKLAPQQRSASHRSEEGSTENRQVEQE
jgi:hypothetical protein